MQHIAWGCADHCGAEVFKQLDLALGAAAGHGNNGKAQAFAAIVEAQASGKEAIAVGIMQNVLGGYTGAAKAAGHKFGPVVEVALGVAHNGSLAGGAAGGVNAHDRVFGYGKHSKGVMVA